MVQLRPSFFFFRGDLNFTDVLFQEFLQSYASHPQPILIRMGCKFICNSRIPNLWIWSKLMLFHSLPSQKLFFFCQNPVVGIRMNTTQNHIFLTATKANHTIYQPIIKPNHHNHSNPNQSNQREIRKEERKYIEWLSIILYCPLSEVFKIREGKLAEGKRSDYIWTDIREILLINNSYHT